MFIAHCPIAVAGSADLRERFLTEAPQKWAEYGKLSAALPLQMERKTWHRDTEKKTFGGEPFEHWHIKRNKSGSLLLCRMEDFNVPSRCCVVNESYAFELRRKKFGDPWIISQVQTDLGDIKGLSSLHAILQIDHGGLRCNGPFMLHKYSLGSLVSEPGFNIRSATTIQRQGLTLVKVDFVCPRDRNAEAFSRFFHYESGWIILDPDRYWSLCEYEAKVTWPGVQQIQTLIRGTVECAQTKSGLPVMKTMLVRIKGRNTKGPKAELDEELKSEYAIEERAPSADEFTLSAFGLPEPFGMKDKKMRWWLWAASAGVVSLVVAGTIRRWKAR
jgi:hypothetical protein